MAGEIAMSLNVAVVHERRWMVDDAGMRVEEFIVNRTGTATGYPPFEGAQVTVFGWFDEMPLEMRQNRGGLIVVSGDDGGELMIQWNVEVPMNFQEESIAPAELARA